MEVELNVVGWRSPELNDALVLGLAFLRVKEPISLPQWADSHFEISKEAGYVEQHWRPWAFQRGIMACIGSDAINLVSVRKSARVGYTKSIVAAMCYFAEHKRRNIGFWQPTDGDSDEFVKTEIEPAIRDIKIMHRVFPKHLSSNKANTLRQKSFLGGMVHFRGGKSAGNYRRLSIDSAFVDEIEAFDDDIDGEGSPMSLVEKRVEGATFPKVVAGSTPKTEGFSKISDLEAAADVVLKYCFACPHCADYHPLSFGPEDGKGKPQKHGLRWVDNEPETVMHCCPHCGGLIDQAQYLASTGTARWQSEDGGIVMDDAAKFYDRTGNPVSPPRHVALFVWTAYSPVVSWAKIAQEYIKALAKQNLGDKTLMKSLVNTTLGLTFREKLEKTDIDLLIERARSSTYTKCIVPFGCVLLLCGLDTQNDRIEAVVWGYGRGMQMWCIDHQVFWGDPEQDAVWIEVEEYLFTKKFNHASGAQISVQASAIDTGGQRTQAVYAFVDRHQDKKIFAVKGYSGRETHIKQSASLVEIDWRGKKIKSGLKLWMVGTNLAKDQIYGRLQIPTPGSGYVNFYNSPTEEFFKQMAGENRVERAVLGGTESRWTANRKRVEAWDCTTYAIWLEVHLGLGKKFPSYWDAMENEVQPVILDLFSQPPAKQGTGHIESSTPALIDVAEVKEEKSLNRLITNDFVPDEWADRGWT